MHTYPLRSLALLVFDDVRRRRDHPLGHDNTDCGDVGRERRLRISEDRQESRLSSSLKTDRHQFHAVVGDTVSELSSEVGQKVLSGATFGDARKKVMRNVVDLESI